MTALGKFRWTQKKLLMDKLCAKEIPDTSNTSLTPEDIALNYIYAQPRVAIGDGLRGI